MPSRLTRSKTKKTASGETGSKSFAKPRKSDLEAEVVNSPEKVLASLRQRLDGKSPQVIAFCLRHLYWRCRRDWISRLKKGNVEINTNEYTLLKLIKAIPGSSQADLSAMLNVKPPSILPLVESLEERGFLKRHRVPEDRRQYAVSLSKKGDAIVTKVDRITLDFENVVFGGLTAQEEKLTSQTLVKLLTRYGSIPKGF